VYVKDSLIAEGDGKSKQEAEQDAARNALEKKGW
jgi:dsRNA-specific ribonuclease